ncbi:complex I NDUFA9 subunit family protein [Paramagnetospirillum magneticum]|uniref:Predicted nucleoside-diphosphate-sugar epimerase n=1 Tax=Paramagnetospirillum magneticum (strain ATCC 700264 / AMB-1) TaxID=342108 RepID=Q2W604_PARM1|nr:complex I NDUFA9 subunit family protein [Paramagnetospirillum magneticum]BAE50721.1 Predicted nucleoside-diphosphate-sugar epimerase [Paramagnetospirillum magneticum AMB-1]
MTRVLIIGGIGFIGHYYAAALAAAGHRVTALGRSGIDLVRDGEAVLAAHLTGHDVVVNAAGLVRGRGSNTMAAVHAQGTERLVRACLAAGVSRLIHLSALGASSHGGTLYQQTKGLGEDVLKAASGLECSVLRPSVVIGRGGASTAVLTALAALPWPPHIGPGTWRVQPVHVDDLAELVVRLVETKEHLPGSLDVVGPAAMTTDELTMALRVWLGLPSRSFLPVPEALLGVIASVGERLMSGPISRDIVAMLKVGNTADPKPFTAILGRAPRHLPEALAMHPACEATPGNQSLARDVIRFRQAQHVDGGRRLFGRATSPIVRATSFRRSTTLCLRTIFSTFRR